MGKDYAGDGIVVHWDASRCIHTGICTRGLPGVFDVRRRPWISLDGALADEVQQVVQRCPTGALRCTRSDGGDQESGPAVVTIEPVPNGPLYVRGPVEVRARDGSVVAEDRLALCRCGATANPPFCDSAHRRVGYRSGDPVARADADSPEQICPPQDF